MAELQGPPAPGHALNRYQRDVQEALDLFKRGHCSWAEMMDRRQAAQATLNGQLADHFLVRAHNVRHLARRARAAVSPDEG